MIDMVAVSREVERGRAELAASSEGILSLNLPIHSNHINHEPHSPPSLMIQIFAREKPLECDPLQRGWVGVVF